MNRLLFRSIAFSGALLAAARVSAQSATPPPAPSIRLSLSADGTVNLAAQNVTVSQILAEWARQCACYVVNADKLTGSALAMPIQFDHDQQGVVLDSLLRQAAGYLLTPRREGSTSPSSYEIILIQATSTAVAAPGSAYPPAVAAAPIVAPPITPVTPGAVNDEVPPVVPQPPRAPSAGYTPAAGPPVPPSAPAPSPTAGVFVPIVPITATPAGQATPASPQPQPGTAPRAAPGLPTPMLPASPTPGR